MPQMKFKVFRRRVGGAVKWYGRIDLPIGLAPGQSMLPPSRQLPMVTLPVTAPGASKASALSNAAGLASQIVNNPFMQTILPPGTGAALKATQLLAKHGPSAAKKLVGKGAKRVGKWLKGLW